MVLKSKKQSTHNFGGWGGRLQRSQVVHAALKSLTVQLGKSAAKVGEYKRKLRIERRRRVSVQGVMNSSGCMCI